MRTFTFFATSIIGLWYVDAKNAEITDQFSIQYGVADIRSVTPALEIITLHSYGFIDCSKPSIFSFVSCPVIFCCLICFLSSVAFQLVYVIDLFSGSSFVTNYFLFSLLTTTFEVAPNVAYYSKILWFDCFYAVKWVNIHYNWLSSYSITHSADKILIMNDLRRHNSSIIYDGP